MIPEAQRLYTALIAAFPSYTTALLAERGYPLDRSSVEAIEQATAGLDAELAAELELPFAEQRRSPLELFRGALAVTAGSLAAAGVVLADSSGAVSETDPYDLAPGSSSALGPEAHTAHLAWGTAKAAAFVGERSPVKSTPAAMLMAGDRSERDQVLSAFKERGIVCRSVRNPGGVADAIGSRSVLVALVDWGHRSAGDAIYRLTAAGLTTVVYGCLLYTSPSPRDGLLSRMPS